MNRTLEEEMYMEISPAFGLIMEPTSCVNWRRFCMD